MSTSNNTNKIDIDDIIKQEKIKLLRDIRSLAKFTKSKEDFDNMISGMLILEVCNLDEDGKPK